MLMRLAASALGSSSSSSSSDVSACIAAAAKAWGPRGGLNHSTAATGTQMRQPETSLLLAWLKTLAQRRPQSALQA